MASDTILRTPLIAFDHEMLAKVIPVAEVALKVCDDVLISNAFEHNIFSTIVYLTIQVFSYMTDCSRHFYLVLIASHS